MMVCAECGAKLEDGFPTCPECKTHLARPGTFLQIAGWVVLAASAIPISVGVISLKQDQVIPLIVGCAALLAGLIMVVVGRIQASASPELTRSATPPDGAKG